MGSYYVAEGEQHFGPFTIDELRNRGVRGDMLVWTEGMEQWKRADAVEELISARVIGPPGTPPPPIPQQVIPVGYVQGYPQAAPDSNRVAAGICGILLGALGIHKFILGLTTQGVIMLLITVLTCGIGGGVMHIIGIIEGIIYLTRSDAEFHELYVVQRKPWF